MRTKGSFDTTRDTSQKTITLAAIGIRISYPVCLKFVSVAMEGEFWSLLERNYSDIDEPGNMKKKHHQSNQF
ncbi:hypothetical protein B7P43_G06307 [Cryptotermes secundus]|uniref:Uncharacterized protein n=1 Tax=Cryptotermes secundus TaxID=105785 RepID=A0A2J7Q7C3_9NEOP|nr:hypothetical protein B7P43_G06307 [Cryptotermes secundus]